MLTEIFLPVTVKLSLQPACVRREFFNLSAEQALRACSIRADD